MNTRIRPPARFARTLRVLLGGSLLAGASSCGDGKAPVEPGPQPTGRIDARVLADGSGVSGVEVLLRGAASKSDTTNMSGYAIFRPLAAGSYTVSIPKHPGDFYFSEISRAVSISPGGTASVSFEGIRYGTGFGPEQFSLIPAGTFQMGDMVGSGDSDELPVHTVSLTHAFYLQKTEVTQGQWRAVLGSNPSYFGSCGDTCPVEQVRWTDVQAFLAALNYMDPGKRYRLPTEAEWEYACRAGTTGDYGGTGVLNEMGWYSDNSGVGVYPVAQKEANAWGLFDMHGNVWEWVQDWYSSDYYSVSPTDDPIGPSSGFYRVFRGGAWATYASDARSASRSFDDPRGKTYWLGFRLAKTTMETPPTPPTITTTLLPWGTVGQSYSVPVAAAGGTTPYTWTISSGSQPNGLEIDSSTGVIGGTPTLAGTSTFTVKVTDAYSLSDTQSLSMTISTADTLGLGIGFGPEQFSLIPAGTFQMGDIVGSGNSDELPVHTVNLTHAFYMQKTEVTQAQWRAVMGSNPSYFGYCGDTCPVEEVTWNDVQAFIAALNAMDPGEGYRLPTEAEWEYAARAGTTGDYGGTGVLDEMGWYKENSGDYTRPVARKQPNAWGLFDMHGNVFEWVQDRYSEAYYSVSPTDDPTGPALESYRSRVLRGGSWDFSAGVARSAQRSSAIPDGQGYNLGFRLARNP